MRKIFAIIDLVFGGSIIFSIGIMFLARGSQSEVMTILTNMFSNLILVSLMTILMFPFLLCLLGYKKFYFKFPLSRALESLFILQIVMLGFVGWGVYSGAQSCVGGPPDGLCMIGGVTIALGAAWIYCISSIATLIMMRKISKTAG